MPVTDFQKKIAKLLAQNRSDESYLAGAAALHFQPNSIRYSQDLDYFHDSEKRVAIAFEADRALLVKNHYSVVVEIKQPGYLRCIVEKSSEQTKIEWAHDSAWRFLPTVLSPDVGYVLHSIDLAINKVLALAGRDEPRDFLDVLYTHNNVLSLGAQIWAACGKDPGFNPLSLLELLKRRGKYHHDDFKMLKLNVKVDLRELKSTWLKAVADSEEFIDKAPPSLVGCLFYSSVEKKFVQPTFSEPNNEIIPHFGQHKGIMPLMK